MSDATKEPEDQTAESTQPDEGGTKLRKVSNGELKGILAAHVKWVESGGKEGECADLHSAYLRKANLQWADLRSADLQGANLADAVLQAANLSGAKLQDANFHSANLHKADLHGTNLRKAVLASANLQEADLRSANLQEADLRGANFFNANLGGADLRGAKVRGAELVKANLREANLRRADLTEANLNGATLEDANLSNTTLDGAKLLGAHLYRTNFQNADIKGAKFQGADLKEANLRDANLQNANFEDAKSFLSEQLAGTNVSGATLPEDIAKFEGLDHVTEISKHARNIFLAVIGGCVFSWLTIATTTDAALLTNSASTPLPIIQTKVPIAGFYWAAPAILLSLYIYLHLYLQRLWEGMASLPAIFPDGRTVDQRAYPWLLSGLVRAHVPLLRENRPSLSRLQVGISMIAAWVLVPFTLFAFWVRYLPRHEWSEIVFLIAALLVSVWSGVIFYRVARATLRAETKKIPGQTSMLGGLAVFFVAIFTAAISYTAFKGDAPFKLFGYTTYADLRYADVSTKPANWSGKDDDIDSIKGADLRKGKLRFARGREAFLVKADLRQADLRKANLPFANLQGANLWLAKLQGAYLEDAKLQGANLTGANLRGAYLYKANLQWAILLGVNLQGADLRDAKGLTKEKLAEACGDEKTKLPEYMEGYKMKPCEEESR